MFVYILIARGYVVEQKQMRRWLEFTDSIYIAGISASASRWLWDLERSRCGLSLIWSSRPVNTTAKESHKLLFAGQVEEWREWREYRLHGPATAAGHCYQDCGCLCLWQAACSKLSLDCAMLQRQERQEMEKFGGLGFPWLVPGAHQQGMARGSVARKPNKPVGVKQKQDYSSLSLWVHQSEGCWDGRNPGACKTAKFAISL